MIGAALGAVGLLAGTLGLALALVGWGRGLARLVGARASVDAGLALALGLALTVVVAGPPNLLALLSTGALRAWVAVGLALALGDALRGRAALRARVAAAAAALREDRPARAAAVAVAALLLLLLASAGRVPLHPADDAQAYAALPLKVLAQGGLGDDPLCVRRLVGGLGGQSLLLALVAATLGPGHLPALEHGIGRLLLVLLVVGASGVGPRGRVALAAAALLLDVWAHNLTSMLGGAGLLLALLRALDLEGRGRALLVAVLLAGLVALKGTYAPAAALLTLAWHLARRPSAARAVVEALGLGLGATLLLAPWMADLWRSNGTAFYPLLGRGQDGAVLGTFRLPSAELTAGGGALHVAKLLTSPVAIAHVVLLALPGRRPDERRALALVAAGGWLAAIAIVLAADGFPRYAAPITTALTLHLLARSLARSATTTSARVAPLVACALLFGADWNERRSALIRRAASLVARRPMVDAAADDGARLRALQAAVPAGARLVAHLSRPFLLDLGRNSVWIMDQPGGAGPPGLPTLTSTPDDLARWLERDVGARYLMVDVATRPPVVGGVEHPWTATEHAHAAAFLRQALALRERRRVVAADAETFVIDVSLSAP